MSYKWYHSIFLLIAALGFFALSEFSLELSRIISDSEPNFKKIGQIIQKDIIEAETYSRMLLEKSKRRGVDEAFRSYSDSLEEILNKKEISIFLFRNDKLVFWSKNLDVSNLNEDTSKYFVSNIQNAWYVGHWITSKSDKILSLILLKNNYPHQNKFLTNNYNKQLEGLEGYNITHRIDPSVKRLVLDDGTTINFEKNIKNDITLGIIKSILQWLSILFIIVAIISFYRQPFFKQKPLLYLLSLSATIIIVRIICLQVGFPNRGLTTLFSPEVYAHTNFNPSLGDYLVNALLFYTLVLFIYRQLNNIVEGLIFRFHKIWGIITAAIVWGIFIVVDSLFASLVMHSTITFETYRIFNLSIFSLIGYFAISLWIVSAVIIADLWTKFFRKHFDESVLALIALFGFIIAFTIAIACGTMPSFYGVFWSISTFILIFWIRYRGYQLSTPWFLVLLCLLSLCEK